MSSSLKEILDGAPKHEASTLSAIKEEIAAINATRTPHPLPLSATTSATEPTDRVAWPWLPLNVNYMLKPLYAHEFTADAAGVGRAALAKCQHEPESRAINCVACLIQINARDRFRLQAF